MELYKGRPNAQTLGLGETGDPLPALFEKREARVRGWWEGKPVDDGGDVTVVRGIRGATTAENNTKEAILAATSEMLGRLIEANDLDAGGVAAAWFTTTPDLNAEFPAVAARRLGWEYVALMCGHEMGVPDGLPRCIRVLVLVNTNKKPQELVNVYLKEARNLRSRGMEARTP